MRNSWEKCCWGMTSAAWEMHLSSGPWPASSFDLFWLIWGVLDGPALLSLPRGWDTVPFSVRSLLVLLLPSPLLPSPLLLADELVWFFDGGED